jgi:rhamnulose-1-phosphate aldolase/alcohol dehydrogenase
MNNLWKDAEAGKSDLEQLIYLSHLIGRDPGLVQPGGGNTSVKLDEDDLLGASTDTLVVKGSGTDLRTIAADGFTHLYRDRLATLQRRTKMTDEEMMEFMQVCMLFPATDPLPSVETPLHALLPAKYVAHTHDVATLSITNTPSAVKHIGQLYGNEVVFLEYVRPGFPLANRLAERYASGPPARAIGLVMEKHGLTVWGDTAKECYERLCTIISKAEAFVAESANGEQALGQPVAPRLDITRRRTRADALLPVIRGELTRIAGPPTSGWRPVLVFTDEPETLKAISGEAFPDVAERGVMTPEHILRAGVKPLVVTLDVSGEIPKLKEGIRKAIADYHADYVEYAKAHDHKNPIPDFLKTVVIPGLGLISAGRDRAQASIATDCYRATLSAIAGAEAVESFEFLSDADACEVEYWPLERRKIEQGARSRRDLDGRVAIVVGGANGIGRATARRFAAEGAHVVVGDIDYDGVVEVVKAINGKSPDRAHAVRMDASDPNELASAFHEAVMRFGGLDILFYSPGISPGMHSVIDMPNSEVERQVRIHFEGAVAATREAAKVMIDQRIGGRLIYNASKAAFAPGAGAAAYGAAKAALVHYVRNVAAELGRHSITANYINADAIDTKLFRERLAERARESGKTEEEMLQVYAERSVLGKATLPPSAVADAAVFLASDRSQYTTGCAITVGGGHEAFPR